MRLVLLYIVLLLRDRDGVKEVECEWGYFLKGFLSHENKRKFIVQIRKANINPCVSESQMEYCSNGVNFGTCET